MVASRWCWSFGRFSVMDGRILIIDDVATNRIVFKVKLGAASYNPLLAAGGREGLKMAQDHAPDLILLDLTLPDLSGVEVLHHLRADPRTRDIPVIMVSASGDPADRLTALAAGADDVFVKPYHDQRLMARVRNLLRARQEVSDLTEGSTDFLFGMAEGVADFMPPGVIAVVTERAEVAMRLRRDLSPLIRDTIVMMAPGEALSDVAPGRASADLYMIDASGPQAERGLRLLSDLRSRAATRHAGICLLTGADDATQTLMALDLGANEVIETTITMDEVALRLRNILRRKNRADQTRERLQNGLRMAMVDPLTGLFNRRYAMARLTAMSDAAREQGRPFAVMIADLDRFKSVNDRFGHAAGDAVLVEVAQRLAMNLRPHDLLARVGGEEFLIAMPATSLDEANHVATRLCAQIEARPIHLANGETLQITVSIGLALSDMVPVGQARTDTVALQVMERADQALLLSKTAGRNTVTIGQSAA